MSKLLSRGRPTHQSMIDVTGLRKFTEMWSRDRYYRLIERYANESRDGFVKFQLTLKQFVLFFSLGR